MNIRKEKIAEVFIGNDFKVGIIRMKQEKKFFLFSGKSYFRFEGKAKGYPIASHWFKDVDSLYYWLCSSHPGTWLVPSLAHETFIEILDKLAKELS